MATSGARFARRHLAWRNDTSIASLDQRDGRPRDKRRCGPGEALTALQPDPAIYHWGAYPEQVRRMAQIAGAGDQLALGLRWAQSGPNWFSLFG